MTDWDLLTPGIGLTSIGIVGVGISLSGIAKTFIDGMHAVSLLTMFIGMIFLAAGIFKDGFPTSSRAKSATFITLGFLVTFGFAAAVPVSVNIPSIYVYIGLIMVISVPAAVIIVASHKQTPYLKALSIIFISGAIVGGFTFYAFGLVTPRVPVAESPEVGTEGDGEVTPAPQEIVNVTILAGSSAEGNPDYEPDVLTVKKGSGIQWVNSDNVIHTVTSLADDGQTFDSSSIAAGESYLLDTSALAEAEYEYFCVFHPYMRAKFILTESATVPASSTTTSGSNASSPETSSDQAGNSVSEVVIPLDSQLPTASVFYEPESITVAPGDSIIWVNEDTALHTATSGDGQTVASDGKFDTGMIAAGESSPPIVMPEERGEFPYFCQVHPFMTGSVIVSSNNSDSPAQNGSAVASITNATTASEESAADADENITGVENDN